MATYAIGDIQGCCDALKRLLDIVKFDPPRDRVWLVGDLVNRGPQSRDTLRFIMSLGDAAVPILGNHDLHLLVAASGYTKQYPGDTLSDILDAPDRDELLHWLRQQKLMHADSTLGYAMVHAGLLPQWSIAKALALAGEVETVLRGDDHDAFDVQSAMQGGHLVGKRELRRVTAPFEERIVSEDVRMAVAGVSRDGEVHGRLRLRSLRQDVAAAKEGTNESGSSGGHRFLANSLTDQHPLPYGRGSLRISKANSTLPGLPPHCP